MAVGNHHRPEGAQPALEGDAIHAMMVRRVETITGCAGHEAELESLTIAINAYEIRYAGEPSYGRSKVVRRGGV